MIPAVEEHGVRFNPEWGWFNDVARVVDRQIRERCLGLPEGHQGGKQCRCMCHPAEWEKS